MKRPLLVPVLVIGAFLLMVVAVAAIVMLSGEGDTNTIIAQPPTPTAVPTTGRGFIGLTVSPDRTNNGLRVVTVEPKGPADAAGVQPGDILRSVDGLVVRTPEQLRVAVEGREPGTNVNLTYERVDRELQARVTLGDAPANTEIEAAPNVITAPARPRLGVIIADITANIQMQFNLQRETGVVITEIQAGSPAAAAGLQAGDVVLAVGPAVTTTVEELQRAITAAPSAQVVDIAIQRGNEQLNIKATLPVLVNFSGLQGLLPIEIQDRIRQMVDAGTLSQEQFMQLLRLYQARGSNVRLGTVKSVNPGFRSGTFILTLAPSVGGPDVTVELSPTTSIRGGRSTLQPADMKSGETVLVISMDGGQTAFLIINVGVL